MANLLWPVACRPIPSHGAMYAVSLARVCVVYVVKEVASFRGSSVN